MLRPGRPCRNIWPPQLAVRSVAAGGQYQLAEVVLQRSLVRRDAYFCLRSMALATTGSSTRAPCRALKLSS